jgi:hypothetical protein
MIAVLRSELYRATTIRSSWVSMSVFAFLGLMLGFLSADMWALMAGLGAFGIAVMATAQHYQHRTAVLLFLGRPRRLTALTAQATAAAIIAIVVALASSFTVVSSGHTTQFRSTMTVVPLMALFGVANATVIRRPTWLFAGYAFWLIFVEGLIGKLEEPLPFSAFLIAGTGDTKYLLIFAGWTAAALVAAVIAIRRDLTTD